jgi:hypothetical protein
MKTHGWSAGMIVPERNLLFTRKSIPIPVGLEWRVARQPWVPRVTAVTALHPWLFTLNPFGVCPTG